MPAYRYDHPYTVPKLKIGLLGGSFDPAHQGHVHISETALQRLDLDRVWWLVSPGNPLKQHGPAAMDRRLDRCGEVINGHPHIHAFDFETKAGTRYTIDTLNALKRTYYGVRFVWMMGADNLTEGHKWKQWQDIFATMPVAVFARPGHQVKAGLSVAAARFARFRLNGTDARALPCRPSPCWTLLSHPTRKDSSTAIRRNGAW